MYATAIQRAVSSYTRTQSSGVQRAAGMEYVGQNVKISYDASKSRQIASKIEDSHSFSPLRMKTTPSRIKFTPNA